MQRTRIPRAPIAPIGRPRRRPGSVEVGDRGAGPAHEADRAKSPIVESHDHRNGSPHPGRRGERGADGEESRHESQCNRAGPDGARGARRSGKHVRHALLEGPTLPCRGTPAPSYGGGVGGYAAPDRRPRSAAAATMTHARAKTSPRRAYGVSPDSAATGVTRTPRAPTPSESTTLPCGSMIPEIPVVVSRTR